MWIEPECLFLNLLYHHIFKKYILQWKELGGGDTNMGFWNMEGAVGRSRRK